MGSIALYSFEMLRQLEATRRSCCGSMSGKVDGVHSILKYTDEKVETVEGPQILRIASPLTKMNIALSRLAVVVPQYSGEHLKDEWLGIIRRPPGLVVVDVFLGEKTYNAQTLTNHHFEQFDVR